MQCFYICPLEKKLFSQKMIWWRCYILFTFEQFLYDLNNSITQSLVDDNRTDKHAKWHLVPVCHLKSLSGVQSVNSGLSKVKLISLSVFLKYYQNSVQARKILSGKKKMSCIMFSVMCSKYCDKLDPWQWSIIGKNLYFS